MSLTSSRAVVAMLRARGWLHNAELLNHGLWVEEVSRRNLAWLIGHRDRPARWFVKAAPPGEPARAHDLRRELVVTTWLSALPELSALQPQVPRVLGFSLEDTWFLQVAAGRSVDLLNPADWSAELGALMGRLHGLSQGLLASSPALPPGLAARAPWLVELARPRPAALAVWSPGELQVVRIVQRSPALWQLLAQIRDNWLGTALLHGDIKGGNLLRAGSGELVLIDWETATLGPPAWDLAAASVDLLTPWLVELGQLGPAAASALQEAGASRLGQAQVQLQALYFAYLAARGLSPVAADELRDALPHFVALRLVQRAVELAQDLDELPNAALIALQLASNLASDPGSHGFALLRLPRQTLEIA